MLSYHKMTDLLDFKYCAHCSLVPMPFRALLDQFIKGPVRSRTGPLGPTSEGAPEYRLILKKEGPIVTKFMVCKCACSHYGILLYEK